MKKMPLILMVDDVPKNLQVLGNLLKDLECELAVATNGRQALAVVEETLPDLILLDVMMPELDGHETCRQLKADPRTKDVPVIFLTAKVESEDILKGFNLGAVDYVTKPFNGAELLTRVRTHLELGRTRAELQHAILAKNKFFDIIAHDLKNPLSTILGFADLLTKEDAPQDPATQQRFMEFISESAKGAFDLLGNLLEWSRLQTGRLEPKLQELTVAELFSEAITFLRPTAEKKGIQLESDCSENTRIKADARMISTVLRNLGTNAIKFTPETGTVLFRGEETDGSGMVSLSVIDTGVGIPAENLKKLFRIEEKFTTKGTGDESGTGLGLILCKDFVEIHGGEIEVRSEEGKGSCFCFTLPRASG